MKRVLIGIAIGLVALRATGGVSAQPDEDRVKKGLVGTWQNVSVRLPAQFKTVEHITPTHYTWVR